MRHIATLPDKVTNLFEVEVSGDESQPHEVHGGEGDGGNYGGCRQPPHARDTLGFRLFLRPILRMYRYVKKVKG